MDTFNFLAIAAGAATFTLTLVLGLVGIMIKLIELSRRN